MPISDQGDLLPAVNCEDSYRTESNFSDLDLNCAEIPNADFTGAKLKNIDFSGSNMASARFVQASLSGVLFLKTNLDYSDFTDALLLNAIFRRAELTESLLFGVAAAGADFRGASLMSANLSNANLSRTQFDRKTHFENTKLFGVSLAGATGLEAVTVKSIIIGTENEPIVVTGKQAQTWLLTASRVTSEENTQGNYFSQD